MIIGRRHYKVENNKTWNLTRNCHHFSAFRVLANILSLSDLLRANIQKKHK